MFVATGFFGEQPFVPIDPSTIAGMLSWHDLSDSGTVTLSGTAIVSVSDKSGNSKTLSGYNSPQYITAGKNGLNVARTNGSNLLQALSLGLNRQSASVYWVGKIVTASSPYKSYMGIGGAGIGNVLFHATNSGSGLGITQPSQNLVQNTNGNTSYSVFRVTMDTGYAMRFDRYVDSQSASTTLSSTSNTPTKTSFGGSYNTSDTETDFLPCEFGEILMYDNILSTSDDADLVVYLKNKWNV